MIGITTTLMLFLGTIHPICI